MLFVIKSFRKLTRLSAPGKMRSAKEIFCYPALAVLEWRTKWKIRVVAELCPALSMQMVSVGVANGGMVLK